MSEPDEYDAYYLPINPEDIVGIEAATARALARDIQNSPLPEVESSQQPSIIATTSLQTSAAPSSPSSDEFDAYDFSEFTDEDFAHIDAMVRSARAAMRPPDPLPEHERAVHFPPAGDGPCGGVPGPRSNGAEDGGGGRSRSGANGGPRIQIAMEGAANADLSLSRPLKDDPGQQGRERPKRSPYDQFRSWSGLLSVTDLAAPSWCEVQFDYGLRQHRHKKLVDRPKTFVTSEGKTITASHSVAAAQDRVVTRGRSVHKVLERELQPEAVQVDITRAEERWALRLINMLVALQSLLDQGRCREMPVFGFVQDQVVTGIIDEVVRAPIEPTDQPVAPGTPPSRSSPNKRVAPQAEPSAPRKSPSKRSRQDPEPGQYQLTAFFVPHIALGSATADAHNQSATTGQTVVANPGPHNVDTHRYSLHLSDTKTRIRPSLPPDEDTVASRVQLMLYHRLLSNVLSVGDPAIPSARPLDFDLLWERVGVRPHRRFSDGFLHQTGLLGGESSDAPTSKFSLAGLTTLYELTIAWRHAVEALNLSGIDKALTLVYRQQPTAHKHNGKSKGRRSGSKQKARAGPSLSVSQQEAEDLAAAIQASMSDMQPGSGGDDELARAIFESLKDSIQSGRAADGDLGVLTHPFGVPISDVLPPPLPPGSGDPRVDACGVGEADAKGGESQGMGTEDFADDPELAWALQQSLLPRLEQTPALKKAIEESSEAQAMDGGSQAEEVGAESLHVPPSAASSPQRHTEAGVEEPFVDVPKTAPSSPGPTHSEESSDEEEITAAELDTEARILGTKKFDLDNAFLDEYLDSILAWWYGQRAPQGVDVELTRRCVSCEYMEGCEWREKKAAEAIDRFRDRDGSPSVAAGWVYPC